MSRFSLIALLLLSAGSSWAEGGAQQAPGWIDFVPLVLLVVIFYFFLIRPQNKRAREHRELVAAIAKGDEVVTAGGIIGKVVKVTDDFIVIETSGQVEISFQKSAVTASLPKGTLKELNKNAG